MACLRNHTHLLSVSHRCGTPALVHTPALSAQHRSIALSSPAPPITLLPPVCVCPHACLWLHHLRGVPSPIIQPAFCSSFPLDSRPLEQRTSPTGTPRGQGKGAHLGTWICSSSLGSRGPGESLELLEENRTRRDWSGPASWLWRPLEWLLGH